MSGGGKSGTTTQQVSIPPEVLARYNSVNARAEDLASRKFQPYTGQFVAGLNQQQMAGMQGINQAANMAQPYIGQAMQTQQQAYQQATPYLQNAMQAANTGMTQAQNQFGQSEGFLANAANQGQYFLGQAQTPIAGALGAAQPYMQSAAQYAGAGLGAAQPMMGAAQNYLQAGTQNVNPQEFGQAQINRYMSPYMRNVVEAQQALQMQESAAQRSALNSQAIGAGAFGGDRAGIAQANLARQQTLANQATLGNLLQQGYGQAAGMFQQQQGVDLAAQQANRQAQQFGSQQAANLAQQGFGMNMAAGQQMAALGQQNFGQQIGQGQALAGLGQQAFQQGVAGAQQAQGLGTAQYGMGAQQAGLQQGLGTALYGMGTTQAGNLANMGLQAQQAATQGAQAQIGAGTLEQQTRQAEMTAQYQQFLQERGYDFQVAQFLANIAMGTGALSGSTTTTTSPMPFMSDRQTKKDVKEIGTTHDGLPIYSFKYKQGDDLPRIGVMADEVREKHPDAVSRRGGVDAVDYEKVADRASMGGGVMPSRAGQGYAPGGVVSDQDLAAIIAMQKQFLGPHAKGGLYGQSQHNLPGTGGIVPQQGVHVARLQSAGPAPRLPESGLSQGLAAIGQAQNLGETLMGEKGLFGEKSPYRKVFNAARDYVSPAEKKQTPPDKTDEEKRKPEAYGGGIRPAYATRGSVDEESGMPLDSATPYGDAAGDETMNQVLKSGSANIRSLPKPGEPPKMGSSNALGDATKLISGVNNLGSMASKGLGFLEGLGGAEAAAGAAGAAEGAGLLGSLGSAASGIGSAIGTGAAAAGEGLAALLALLPFSDERVKSNMERVGKLDNGQPVYKYNIGNGPTQLGLSAQNVSEYGDPSAVYRDADGFLHLDYDRASKGYGGGLRPGFATQGAVGQYDEIIRKYAEEEGVPFEIARRIAQNESSMKPGAQAGTSSAGGLFGIINRTLEGLGGDPRQKYDPEHNAKYGVKYVGQNYRALAGGEDDPDAAAKTYLGHFLGTSGARNVLANAESPISETLSNYAQAVAANRNIRAPDGTPMADWTGQHAIDWARAKMSGESIPSDGRRRSVAGAESVVENGNRQDYVDGKRQSGGLEPPMDFRTGKPYESWGDFATSRQFLIPLLSGLGGMAQSKSMFLGPAVLEGLGAGAQAYANLEGKMTAPEFERAGTEKVRAETEGVLQQNIQRSLQYLPDGTKVVWVNGPQGPKFMFADEYDRLRREGREPPLLGNKPPNAEKLVSQEEYRYSSGQPSTGAKKSADGTTPPGQTPTTMQGFNLSPEAAAAADEERSISVRGGDAAKRLDQASTRFLTKTMDQADAANTTIKGTGDIAQNIADNAQKTGFDTMGFGFQLRSQYASLVNTILRSQGSTDISNADSAQEIQRKLQMVQAELNAISGGQRADATLDRLYSANPDLNMNPKAAAKLAADLWVASQRAIDRDAFRIEYGKKSNQSFAQADRFFNQAFPVSRYQNEQKALQEVILQSPDFLRDMRAGKLNPQQINKTFEKWLGQSNPLMYRYFVSGGSQ